MSKSTELCNEAGVDSKAVAVPFKYIELTGDANSAVFLAQCVYWQEVKGEGVWWYKTDKAWEKELQVGKKARQRIIKLLKEFGLEVEVRRIYNTNVNFYRINYQTLKEALETTKEEVVNEIEDVDYSETEPVEPQVRMVSSMGAKRPHDGCETTPHSENTSKTTLLDIVSSDEDIKPVKEKQPRAKRTPKPNNVEVSPEASELYELSRSFFNRSIATKSWFEFILREYGRKRVMVALKIGRLAGIPNSAYIGRIIARLTDDELKKYDDDGNETRQVAPGRKFTDEEIERRLRERNAGTWLEK